MQHRRLFIVFVLFFFVSGASGLICEVLWMREFGLVMGTTAVALSAVLTSFMSGLALGAWLGGRWADRAPRPLTLYGRLEILIGLFALAMPWLIKVILPALAPLYRADPNGWPLQAVRFAFALILMLIPTTFMGATLPVLVRFFTASPEEVGSRVGWLYGVNTVGAMVGAAASGFFLIPLAGMRATGWIAAAGNFLVGLGALALSRKYSATPLSGRPKAESAGANKRETEEPAQTSSLAIAVTLAVIAASGAAAMIYQVCWTRMFALLVGSSTYAFSIVLAATIGGLAVGALVFGPLADREKARVALLAGIEFAVAAGALAIAWFSPEYPTLVLILIRDFGRSYPSLITAEFFLAVALLFIPNFFMGGVFPVAARICARSMQDLGSEIGRVYAVNTIGAVVGSFTAAFVFIKFLGIGSTMLVAIGLSLAGAVASALAEPAMGRAMRGALAGAIAIGALLVALFPPRWEKEVMASAPYAYDVPDRDTVITRQTIREGAAQHELLYYRDGLAGTVSVRQTAGPLGIRTLAVNGKVDASDGPSDMPTQLVIGHIGPVLRPTAKQVMVLGLGSGVTLGGVLKHPSIEHVDVVEISPQVVEAVRLQFAELNGHALDDPRVRVIIADGRNHLALTDETYDLILSEPSNPWVAGIAFTFTREFHELALKRLAPEGLIIQWMHLYNISREDILMVMKTFFSTVPAGMVWEAKDTNILFVGAHSPMKLDWNAFKKELELPNVRDDLARSHLERPEVFLTQFIATREGVLSMSGAGAARLNDDDTCKLEFSAPKSYYDPRRRIQISEAYLWRESPRPVFAEASVPPETAAWFETISIARREAKKELDSPGTTFCDVAGGLEHVIPLNPFDYAPRDMMTIACDECALEHVKRNEIPQAREMLKRGIDAYESLHVTYDYSRIQRLYEHSRELAEQAGDAEAAKMWDEKLAKFLESCKRR